MEQNRIIKEEKAGKNKINKEYALKIGYTIGSKNHAIKTTKYCK